MNWLFFALLAPATYAVNNFIDKYLLESKVKDYRGMPLYSAIAGFIFGFIAWMWVGFATLPLFDSLLVVSTGVLSVVALALYFQVLSKQETSTVILLFQLVPALNLVLSYLFLGEVINSTQLIGFLFVLTAALGATVRFNRKEFQLSNTLWLLLASDCMWALANILFKFVSQEYPFPSLLAYEGWGFAVGGILMWFLYPASKVAFLENFKQAGTKVLMFIFINESIYILARLFTYFALTLSSVALVSIVGSAQVFFGVLYGFVLTILFPKIFKEEIDQKNITRKVLLALLAFIGIYLVGG